MKPSKYYNNKTEVDGIVFDSLKEANYYCELKLLKQAKLITGFERQVTFKLQPSFRRRNKSYTAITYRADFVVHYPDGHTEVIDVKGYQTKEYKIKKKMLLFNNPDMIFREV